MEKESNFIQYLEYLIQTTYNKLVDCFSPGMIEAWLTEGVSLLYVNGIANLFIKGHKEKLEACLDKEVLLGYLINNYVKTIQEQPAEELELAFEKVVKKTEMEQGEKIVQKAIRSFIEKSDPSGFSECEKGESKDEEFDFKKYKMPEVVRIMASKTVKRVLKPIIEYSEVEKDDTVSKEKIHSEELAVVSERQHGIEDQMDVMGSLRDGKIPNSDKVER